jgi:hypothetical protein
MRTREVARAAAGGVSVVALVPARESNDVHSKNVLNLQRIVTHATGEKEWETVRIWLATRCPAFLTMTVQQGKRVPEQS